MILYAGGYLAFYTPDQNPEMACVLADQVPLRDLLSEIGIPAAEVQLVILNGAIVDLEQTYVQNQDVVKIFPGVDGG
ncbi:MAG: MoaD/ThiS family protein [Brevefilum sp.]|nr:MoaD/ThiS family protein [Brevefilum sp.]